MDEDRIGLVLVRVSELRSKVTNCIEKAFAIGDNEEEAGRRLRGSEAAAPEAEHIDDDEEEADSLLNIRDALESLESQLVALQALQEQQLYEKESALAAIRFGQKKLLEKLKEYKGEDLEVVQEAIAFAGETVEDNNDLLLPPYPSRPSRTVVSDNDYLSRLSYARKITPNGVVSSGVKNEFGQGAHESQKDEMFHDPRKKPVSRVRALIGTVAKAAVTVVGFISVLSLAGYEPRLRKRENQFKLFGGAIQQEDNGESGIAGGCPPGKVPVMVENGEIRCMVKERVEIPFETQIANPDVKYGCG